MIFTRNHAFLPEIEIPKIPFSCECKNLLKVACLFAYKIIRKRGYVLKNHSSCCLVWLWLIYHSSFCFWFSFCFVLIILGNLRFRSYTCKSPNEWRHHSGSQSNYFKWTRNNRTNVHNTGARSPWLLFMWMNLQYLRLKGIRE